MYLVLSWKKTLYWISLDISKLFCKTLLFTRKKKDKLEEAIFKSPQIQTRSKVFFFRLEKKPERRKKKTLWSLSIGITIIPPPPAARHQFRKLHGARGHARKKEGNARLSRARREVILFPSGETHHRLFFSIRGESIGLLPLPFPIFLPSPAPQESRNERSRFVSRRRHASNVSCIKIILILVFEGGEEWEILAFSRAYIYIYTLVRFLSAREKRWYPTIIERVASTVSVNGRGRPSRVIFLVSKEYNTESRSFPPPHYGDRFKLASFMGIWLHRCCTCACGYFSLFLYLFEGNRWRVEFLWLIRELNVARGDA